MALADIEPGEVRPVTVDGLRVAVARGLDGSVHALADRCAHAGARLSSGRLLQKVVGDDVDEYRLTDELVLRCPWHGYEYELSSGRCIADPANVARTGVHAWSSRAARCGSSGRACVGWHPAGRLSR